MDILQVPMSSNGNQYLLVAQDYFSKWPFAMALPDQKAATIVKVLRDQVLQMVGPPRMLHLDQGKISIFFLSYVRHLGGEIPHDPLLPNGRWTSQTDELHC